MKTNKNAVCGSLKYMPQLNGLRALAVTGVLISHYGLGENLQWITSSIPWGFLGVRLFFVLSGFLITRILLDTRLGIEVGSIRYFDAFRSFYIRRFLRIFPIFYVTILFAWCLDVGNMRDVLAWHLTYLSNFKNAIYFEIGGNLVLRDPTSAHFWSLAVEEQFYLIWPAIIFLAGDRKLIAIIVAMIVLSPLWRLGYFVFFPTDPMIGYLPSCLDTLGTGALLAIYREQGSVLLSKFKKYTSHLLVFGIICMAACLTCQALGIFYRPRMIVLDFGCAVVFSFLISRAADGNKDLFGSFLLNPFLQYIGKISYGIYVLHAFMAPLQLWIWEKFQLPSVENYGFLRFSILTFLTLFFAGISWSFFEAPINRLKRIFAPTQAELKKIEKQNYKCLEN